MQGFNRLLARFKPQGRSERALANLFGPGGPSLLLIILVSLAPLCHSRDRGENGGQAMSDGNATEILKLIIYENPHADPEHIFRLFIAKAGEHWDEISRVWFTDVIDTLDLNVHCL